MSLDAKALAESIFSGFVIYRELFENYNSQALRLFEDQDWHAVQQLTATRLSSHNEHLLHAAEQVRELCEANGLDAPNTAQWHAAKQRYTRLLSERYDYELGETFYNSVHRRVNENGKFDAQLMYVQSAFTQPPQTPIEPIYTSYYPTHGVVEMLRQVLHNLPLSRPWRDFDRDIKNVLRSLPEERPEITSTDGLELQMLNSLFFRNKGAYAIGKLVYRGQIWPVALPILLNSEGQLYVDTLICDEDELSIMFSFTRSYFMVDTHHPSVLVEFLNELLPNKKPSELYAAVGLHKHGKTEFYRGFLDHLEHSNDQFIIAPGIKGMVMSVFTLPSYQTVFKIIKDKFAPQKNITRRQVREKYYVVKRHDRVGRMADTQEFENLSLPRARFSPELLAELQAVAASSIELTADTVTIKHLYTERLMTPLNLYIEAADDDALREALDEYGNAIRQLAAANIFPGDMLLKNFGVTRHGRVVFYDYDEICYLTDINFRAIPQPQTPEQEMSADVWYSVAENDVFPEEFRRFLFGKRRIKELFTSLHGELFDADYWRELQSDIKQGEIRDVFPYRRKKRFIRQG